MKRQHGLLLLPVAIALAVMGALAYSMTRGGAADAGAVDAQYDVEATRYLAEAGLRLAKWQNEKKGCKSELRFTNVRLPGVAGAMSVSTLEVDKEKFKATVTATSDRGTVSSLSGDKMMFFDRSDEDDTTLKPKDTYISSISPNESYNNSGSLAATDGKAHILVSMPLGEIPNDARATKATLWMFLSSSNSVQTVRGLAAHAVTRGWSDGSATWNSPWNTSPGGSYDPRPETFTPIAGAGEWYKWELGPLVRRWESGAQNNFGVLLKPTGLNGAIFNSVDAGIRKLYVDVSYHLRCK